MNLKIKNMAVTERVFDFSEHHVTGADLADLKLAFLGLYHHYRIILSVRNAMKIK